MKIVMFRKALLKLVQNVEVSKTRDCTVDIDITVYTFINILFFRSIKSSSIKETFALIWNDTTDIVVASYTQINCIFAFTDLIYQLFNISYRILEQTEKAKTRLR